MQRRRCSPRHWGCPLGAPPVCSWLSAPSANLSKANQSLTDRKAPTLQVFSFTCLLQAVCRYARAAGACKVCPDDALLGCGALESPDWLVGEFAPAQLDLNHVVLQSCMA